MKQPRYNALIIDDEEDGREYIAHYLELFFPSVNIAGKAGNIVTGQRMISDLQPDMIFMDVELGEGTGFDLLEQIPDNLSSVIFVTGHEHYALQAIKASALDYLLKPLNREEFEAAVTKAIRKADDRYYRQTIGGMMSRIQHNLGVRKITIPTITGFSLVEIDDIIRCEASDNYTVIYFARAPKIVVSRSLHDYEEELSDYSFIRIHHKHLINLRHVKEYAKGKGGGTVLLDDGTILEVSVRKKPDLLNAFHNHLRMV